MIVNQIWTANSGRNFNYLVVCPETGEALAIDPLDHEKCLTKAKDEGWTITQVLNTHEHWDHTSVATKKPSKQPALSCLPTPTRKTPSPRSILVSRPVM